MTIKSPSKIAFVLILMSFLTAPVCAGDKEDKEKLDLLSARIEEMKTEMIMLEHQAQSLRDSIIRVGGEQISLIAQIIRNVSAVQDALAEMKRAYFLFTSLGCLKVDPTVPNCHIRKT